MSETTEVRWCGDNMEHGPHEWRNNECNYNETPKHCLGYTIPIDDGPRVPASCAACHSAPRQVGNLCASCASEEEQ